MKKILFILTLSLLCTGMSWAQNVIFVKSGVTDGETITVNGVSGAAYTTCKAASLAAAIGDTVKLLENITEEGVTDHPYTQAQPNEPDKWPYQKCCFIQDGFTFDGNGFTLTVTGPVSGTYGCGIYTKGGTIKNVTINGGFRSVFSGGINRDIVIDNCVINPIAYPFNTDAANINYSVSIINSTLNGWCSYTGPFKNVSISNTTFAQGNTDYAYFRPYSSTVLEDVTFDNSGSEGYSVDPRQSDIFFNDCNLSGTPITSENFNDILIVDQEAANNKAVVVNGNFSQNADGEITGGIYGGSLPVLNSKLASGYAAFPLNTNPQTYQVDPVYYIHFNANGGSGTMEDSYVPREAPNNVFTVPACTFTHASFPFLKWNTKAYGNGTDLAENDPMTLTSDTTLYAIWNCVAMIGTTCYATLDAAIDAAVANDVIEIIASTCEITNTKVLPANVTLKGQGKNATTMTIASTSGSGLTINNAGVTIKDMHIDGSQITSGGYKTLVNVRADNVVIDNVIMSGGGMSTWNSSILVETLSSSQTFTVSNSTISGSFRGILRESCNANLVIDNCDITAIYPFNIDGGNGGTITVTNGSLRGWTSYSGVDKVTFKDVEFGKGAGYAVLRPYVNTEIEGSSFSSEFKVDPIIAPSILFNNCDLAGTPLTSANIDNLLADQATDQAVSQEDPRSHAVVVNGGYSTNDNDEITGGIYGGNPEVLNTMIASGYAAFPLNTDPQTYQVDPAYFIHFDAAGGTGTQGDSVVMRANPTFVVPENTEFSYGSYAFLNWNSKPYGAGTDIAVGSTMTLSSDTTLYAEWNIDFVAKIGDNTYPTIQAAVDYANENLTGDVTIDLVKSTSEVVKILQKDGISINLNGNDVTLTGQIFISNRQGDPYPAYTGTYTESNTVTIDNLNMKYDPAYFDSYGSSDEAGLIYFCKNCAFGGTFHVNDVLNYSHNVTISNCNFDADGSNQGVYGISSIAGTVYNLNIDNCTAKNAAGLATLQSAPEFEVTNCSTEDVKYGIRIVNNNGPMTVTGNNFTADEAGILVTGMTTGATINFADNNVQAPKAFELASSCTSGTLDITSGTYIGAIDDNTTSDFFNISGGTYSEDVSGEPCEEGYAAFKNGTTPETWTVTKAWFLRYNANGGTGTTMDSVFVKQSDDAAGRTVTVADCDYTYDSYAFAEWNTKADGTGNRVAPGAQLTLTQDTVLYAQWARVKNVTQDKYYNTLQAAINDATAGDSLLVLTDMNIEETGDAGRIKVNKSIVINGDKHLITTKATRGLGLENGTNLDVTLRNFYMTCNNIANQGPDAIRGVQIYNTSTGSHLLLDSCRIIVSGISDRGYALNFPGGADNVTVTVKNSYIQGWDVLNSYSRNSTFIFDNDTLYGLNTQSSSSWDNFQTFTIDGNGSNMGYNNNVSISKSVIIAEQQGTCTQGGFSIQNKAAYNSITLDCATKIIDRKGDNASKILEVNRILRYMVTAPGNELILFLDDDQLATAPDHYTLTDVSGGECNRTRISFSVRYTFNNGNNSGYYDFHYPFTTHNVAEGDLIELLEDVTMKQDVYSPFPGNFNIHFKDGSETHTINQGGYTVVLDDNQTCTTDKQALALFSSINGSSITETDHNNGTWTYSVTPYNIITYYSNNSADEVDAQTKPNGETVNLYDYKTFDHADSTIYRWNTQADGNGTDYALGAPYSADANLVLFAVWRLNLDMEMDSTDVVCYGENNGTDTVKIIGGEAPFQLVLSGTVMAENDTVKNLMDRTHIFTNLKPGKYNVQLTDVLKKDTIRGTFTIAQPDTLEITALTVPEDFPCPLMGNGYYDVSVTAQGGNGGYHYTWSEAAVNIDAAATRVVSGADDRDSIYTVKVVVTDSKNCTAEGIKTFTVSKVIADDGTVHSNSKLTIDTIRVGIMSGCDTVYKEYGTPVFTTTIPGGYPEDRLTIVNNIATAYPDSVFYLGENKIIWTATDTCGHSITGEQVLIVYHFPCPNVTDVDGNDYPSVRLGCDCWMAENLKTTKYSDGRAISNLMKYESPTHPDAEANFAIYGYLYDWTAALDAEGGVTPDADGNVQGVCPTGWHMPTDLDFANVAGVQGRHDISDLRSTDYWLDGGGNNSTNFNLLPGGFYNDNTARYENILGEAYLWSVNSADPSQPKVFWADCHCYMWQVGDPSANMGASVRCVKD